MEDTKIEFVNCKLELELEAQSPLIHFQYDQNGATLRASEVKPKLDRFLLKKMAEEAGIVEIADLKKNEEYKSLFIDLAHEALQYKMKIVDNNPKQVELDSYKIFWCNNAKNPVRGIVSNPCITIYCFHEKLRKLIVKNIIEFFLVTNFGRMQGKGFGSFLPVKCNSQGNLLPDVEKAVTDGLRNATERAARGKKGKESAPCYYIEFKQPEKIEYKTKDKETAIKCKVWEDMFAEINSFYKIMKSGLNETRKNGRYVKGYIFKYMLEKGIPNEKAWMKDREIAPKIGREENSGKKGIVTPTPKYVRAMLGLSPIHWYLNKPNPKVKISIKNIDSENQKAKNQGNRNDSFNEKQIQRMASPIFFKIIGNRVYITTYDVPVAVYNKEFMFTGMKKGKLFTPRKEEFDIYDFLEKYVVYYNGEVKKKIPEQRKVNETKKEGEKNE